MQSLTNLRSAASTAWNKYNDYTRAIIYKYYYMYIHVFNMFITCFLPPSIFPIKTSLGMTAYNIHE